MSNDNGRNTKPKSKFVVSILFLAFAITLFIYVSPANAQIIQLPAVGMWNGYNQQNNVVECSNVSNIKRFLQLTIRNNDSSELASIPLTLEPHETKHLLLNSFPIAEAYGSYVIEALDGPSAENLRLACATVFYRLSSVTGEIEYSYALPVQLPLSGAASGIFNSISPEGLTVPVQNWLSVYNAGSEIFHARVRIYDQQGQEQSAHGFRIQHLLPGERRDFPLGHDRGQVVGLYRIIPDQADTEYGAFITRYNISGAAYNFAFPLQALVGSCDSGPMPASTLPFAANWAEVANPTSRTQRIRIEVRDALGELVLNQAADIPARAQYHLSLNSVLTSTGSFRVRCRDNHGNRDRVIVQSLFYGRNNDLGSVTWGYATQALGNLARRGDRVVFLLNQNLNASNWARFVNQRNAEMSFLKNSFNETGGSDNVGNYSLLPRANLDSNFLLDTPLIGHAVTTTNTPDASSFGELRRVFFDNQGNIDYIMNMPSFVFRANAGGGSGSSSSTSSTSSSSGTSSSTSSTSSTGTSTSSTGSTSTSSTSTSSSGGSSLPMSTASRTSGVAPLAVFFDAVLDTTHIVAPAIVDGRREYDSFHYQWDFGDDASATWATSGLSKNLATGYVTGHVYENPGTYQVRLEVLDANGDTHRYIQQISVADPNTTFTGNLTRCVSTSGNFSGCPTGAEQVTSSNFPTQLTWLFSSNGPRRVLFRRDETFVNSGGSTVNNRSGPFTIGAYGTGTNPEVTSNDITSAVITLGASTTDVRVVNVDFIGNGVGQAIRPGTNMLVLRSQISNFDSGVSTSSGHGNKERNFIVDSLINDSARYGIYYNFGQHVAVLGTTIDDVSGEHLLRCYLTHSLVAHNVFRGGHPGKHQLKFKGYFPTGHPDRPAGTPTEAVEYSIIANNLFEQPESIDWVIGIGPVDASKDQRVTDSIFEANTVQAVVDTQAQVMLWARYMTVRNNIFLGNGSSGSVTGVWVTRRGVEPVPLGNRIYNNTFYRGEALGFNGVRIDALSQDTTVINNLMAASGGQVSNGSGTGLVARNNLLTTNPGFQNASGGNFQLQANSPAVDAGEALPAVRSDTLGVSRPVNGNGAGGSEWDLGAFEYQP